MSAGGHTRRPRHAAQLAAWVSTLAILRPRASERLVPSPLRNEILGLVTRRPGIPLSQLRSDLPIGWGTLYHHVWRLCKDGKLETRTVGRRRLLYPAGVASEEFAAIQGLLRGKTVRKVATAVLSKPSLSFKELVETTGESDRVVYYHLKRLMDVKLVASSSKTRHFGLMPTDLLRAHAHLIRALPAAREPVDGAQP